MIGLFVNRQRDSSGGVTLTPRPAAGILVTARGQGLQGWAVASDGSSYSEELGSTPVPSTAIRSQGLAFTPDGALYTTVSAPTSTSAKIGGFAVRADGALHLADSTTVGAIIQGIKVTADGRLITSAPWTFPEVTRYWDARQGVTAPGNRVSNWLDIKLSTDLAQASGAAQPVWDGSAITFDGAAYFLQTANFTLNQPCSMYAVMQIDAYTAGTDVFLSGKQADTAWAYSPVGGSNLVVYAGAAAAAAAGPAASAYHVIRGVLNEASSGWSVDLGALTTGDAGTNNPGGVTVGANYTGLASFSQMSCKALALCPSALSAARAEQLIRAMAAQTGVSL